VTFSAYLDDLPLLHTWDGGEKWNTGGFNASQLRSMHDLIRTRFGEQRPSIIETGAGNSTITFLHLDVERLVSIAPAGALKDRIVEYCAKNEVDVSRLDFRVTRSEAELPAIALTKPTPRFDVALIDGGHGWPTVFVDFCYLNMMLGTGGLLLLDDLQLHSVAELSRLLEMQPGFTMLDQWKKLQVWEKGHDEPFMPEHSREPYIAQMSDERWLKEQRSPRGKP